jgi:hypothetical protein
MTVARIVPDSRISNSILVGTREQILKSVRRKRQRALGRLARVAAK